MRHLAPFDGALPTACGERSEPPISNVQDSMRKPSPTHACGQAFRSNLLFAVSCGSWRPGNSTLPLLHDLKEIFYGVIDLHCLQTTGASKVSLEGLSASFTLS